MILNILMRGILAILMTALTPLAASATLPDVLAPDFELSDLSGTTVKLSDHRGTVVVLNFWATWCTECVGEMPSLNSFAEQYRGKAVTVLSVSIDRSDEVLKRFLADHPAHFPVLRDADGDVFVRKYATRALPATVIIDRQGRIAARLPGRQDFLSRGFRNRVEKLLKGGNER